jgi:hypothetical protein
MDFSVTILKPDLYEVLHADFRNVITFVLSHTTFSVLAFL